MPERMRAVDGKQEIYLEWPNNAVPHVPLYVIATLGLVT